MRLRGTGHSPVLNLRVGDVVEVRSEQEILETLDARGTLEGLPFMPEMLKYCGKRFRVFKRADKTCDTIEKTGLRRMKNTIHLEGLRCDGEAHGRCQATCLLFWKEAWLKEVRPGAPDENEAPGKGALAQADSGPWKGESPPDAAAVLMKSTRGPADAESGEETFVCQATQLLKASSPLPWWDIGQYVRDWTSGNVGLLTVLRGVAISAFNAIQRFRGGRSYPFDVWDLQGKLIRTPGDVLNLQPGELVQVKTKEEIAATLNRQNKNRGLWFDVEMLKYCGGKYRVSKPVNRIISEKTGKMLNLPGECIILEGVMCAADYHQYCPRSIYHYWREIWLRRDQ